MSYTKTELKTFGTDTDELRKKIVNISIFDHIDDLTLSTKTKNQIDFTKELYEEYLVDLQSFSEINQQKILKTLMNTEVIDNHVVEKENIDYLNTYSETHHSTAVNYLIRKMITEDNYLNETIFKKAHEILMRGTSKDINSGYRNKNDFYVGYQENNETHILYLPISYKEIKQATDLLFSYYNLKTTKEEELFTKPFIIHGLIAALQLFPDGNTRLARSIQHIKLLITTNDFTNHTLNLPAIYFSKAYIPYREEYRNLIAKIALKPDHESWENWINFNLFRLQDQIYYNEQNISRVRKK